MFEKEAEEFTDSKKSFWRQGRTCIDSVKQAFLAGAEFGYNKAMNEIGYRIESAYREGVAFGKDKAKEEMQAQIEK